MPRSVKGAAAGVAVLVILAGCAAPGSAAPAAPAPSEPSTGYPTLGPADVASEDLDALVDPDAREVVPTWTEESRRAALDVAMAAMQAWARPDLPHEQWWAGLQGYLSPGAREVVVMTDPANIPVTTVTDVQLPDEGETAYVGWVEADTDDGPWWVLVACQPDGSWLVDRITRSHEVTR